MYINGHSFKKSLFAVFSVIMLLLLGSFDICDAARSLLSRQLDEPFLLTSPAAAPPPSPLDRRLDVCYIADKGYFPPLLTSVYSLIVNIPQDSSACVYVLDAGLDPGQVKALNKLNKTSKPGAVPLVQVVVTPLNLPTLLPEGLAISELSGWSPIVFAKLFLPELPIFDGVSHLWYFDADTCCIDSKCLFQYQSCPQIVDCPFAMTNWKATAPKSVLQRMESGARSVNPWAERAVDLGPEELLVDSGVILFNIDFTRKHEVVEDLRKKLTYVDLAVRRSLALLSASIAKEFSDEQNRKMALRGAVEALGFITDETVFTAWIEEVKCCLLLPFRFNVNMEVYTGVSPVKLMESRELAAIAWATYIGEETQKGFILHMEGNTKLWKRPLNDLLINSSYGQAWLYSALLSGQVKVEAFLSQCSPQTIDAVVELLAHFSANRLVTNDTAATAYVGQLPHSVFEGMKAIYGHPMILRIFAVKSLELRLHGMGADPDHPSLFPQASQAQAQKSRLDDRPAAQKSTAADGRGRVSKKKRGRR
ncbi:MAG: hypothetical protein LBI30_01855 [Holosporales bacterium]|jgi:hypothetical protein|nr:hypothetical protein [Holosporales bacterium]